MQREGGPHTRMLQVCVKHKVRSPNVAHQDIVCGPDNRINQKLLFFYTAMYNIYNFNKK